MNYKIINGDSAIILDTLPENFFDACITDPPYELGYMGKKWDSTGIAFNPEFWKKLYRVLKPGAYFLAFGGSRTFHRIAVAIEDAGFEIRDTIMWLYKTGFPKSMDIGKSVESKLTNGSANTQAFKNLNGTKIESGNWGMSKLAYDQNSRPFDYSADKHLRTLSVDYQTEEAKKWDGYGTALKPAFEPVIIARKPPENSTTDNVIKWGVGAININECRVNLQENETKTTNVGYTDSKQSENWGTNRCITEETNIGRFPANVIFTNVNDDEVTRYFYCAKTSKKDRDEGLFDYDEEMITDGCVRNNQKTAGSFGANFSPKKNTHPTVKPTELMQYLIRLVCPPNSHIIDPFNGSGSTGKAAAFENRERNMNYSYTGIELDMKFCKISESRIDYALNQYEYDEKEERKKTGQMSLFDDF